jgi:hypothetical protein
MPGLPGARPNDIDTGMPVTGCWPAGTWTFTAKVDSNECKTPPAVLASYSFRVDRMDEPNGQGLVENYANLTTVNGLQWHIAVSSNGAGCEGNFEFGTADGKQYWHMQPTLLNPTPPSTTPSLTLSGSGDYALYNNDAWPWK